MPRHSLLWLDKDPRRLRLAFHLAACYEHGEKKHILKEDIMTAITIIDQSYQIRLSSVSTLVLTLSPNWG